MKKITLFLLLVAMLRPAFAKEGMWIPTLLGAIEDDMQAFGLQLTAEDIYSVNKSSLKDAILQFGGGCTAEVISSEGLILTNHHCGYRQIQSHSSVANNYLKDGFWAMSREQELANPGLTAMFIVSMTDVTAEILLGVTDEMPLEERRRIISQNERNLVATTLDNSPGLDAFVRPFNYGNSYFLMLTRTFKDVRLVGAPPSAVGKFGGDTDNWVWPRHTGDFSMFRIYADQSNNPAEFSTSNQPYKAPRHLPVSLDGVEEGDFTMVFGFPGRTDQYLTKAAVEYVVNEANPMRIHFRETSLGIIDAAMRSDEAIHIQYAAKQSSISNAYKKWIGQNAGLKELNALGKKNEIEGAYLTLARIRKKLNYADNILALEGLNNEIHDYALARDVFIEYYFYGPELYKFANSFSEVVLRYDELSASGELTKKLEALKSGVAAFFKDYHQPTDELLYEKMTALYFHYMPTQLVPKTISDFAKQGKVAPATLRASVYGKSIFTQKDALMKLLNAPSAKAFAKLKKDIAFSHAQAHMDGYNAMIRPAYSALQEKIDVAMATYVKGLMELFPDNDYWFDANSTLRLTYGKVEGSEPYDGEAYKYYTTTRGLLQKNATNHPDFELPEDLKSMFESGFFGPYAHEDGELRVCFTGSNHTTGGNSGSPAINGRGELVGLNFDRSWESTMSDIYYDADRCRNIMVDVRYILFIVDAYAGAGHLIEEMTIVRNKPSAFEIPMRK
jgi:hypothetical protein